VRGNHVKCVEALLGNGGDGHLVLGLESLLVGNLGQRACHAGGEKLSSRGCHGGLPSQDGHLLGVPSPPA